MYDVIIVGARCAGSPTAMLLARKGYRVLLVDRTAFPDDAISTHIIWPPGVTRLRRWGLLDAVAASGCPPIRRVSFDVGEFALVGTPPPHDGGSDAFAPRRTVLDAILVNAAAGRRRRAARAFRGAGPGHAGRARSGHSRPSRGGDDGHGVRPARRRRRRRAFRRGPRRRRGVL
jgi:2-polyprenyl-6-methoxyphenol hydroxylase-like FAD-dependent oxidoreductase